MKKTILAGTLLLAASGVWAQKARLRDTRDYLSDQNFKKAINAINEAANSEDTKNNPETWDLRGYAYLQKAMNATGTAPGDTAESYTSFMKALSIKPDYSSKEISNGLYTHAMLFFNSGVAAFQSNPGAAYDNFMKVVEIYNMGGGKRFASNAEFAKLAADAKSNAAYSAMNAKKDNEALSLLNELRTTTGAKDSIVYQSIIEIYSRQNNDAQVLPIITEARTKFPQSQLFRNLELNYYIRKGQPEVLLGKLEDAVKADPNNPELLFNLANIYERAAFPKDEKGVALAKPANHTEMFSKAESAYQNALNANPNNPDYNYNFGVLYYESATDLTKQMNAIKGTSPTEQKQYDALLAQRDAFFTKALPHFEKAYSLLDAKASSLDNNEKVTYYNTMIGLREIYSRRNNKAKTDELKTKLEALRK